MRALTFTPAAWLAVDALSTFRLTRLATADTITERARQWIKRKAGTRAYYFVTCPWCTSVWIAGGVVALTRFAAGAWAYAAALLTFSAVAGFLSEH